MTTQATIDEGAPAAERPPVDSLPFAIWAGVAAVSVIVRTLASPGGIALERWDSLSQWASTANLDLADRGYRAGHPFVMPGYAALVRSLTWVTGGRITTAVLVSYLASAVAAWLFWEWLRGRGVDRATRAWSLVALLVFPYSFAFYGVVGADGLVLALVLGAFVLIDRDQPWIAGLVAAAAIVTQVTALAVVPALIVMAWSTRPAMPRSVAGADAGSGTESESETELASDTAPAPGPAAPGSNRVGLVGAAAIALLGPIGLSVYLAVTASDAGWPWRGDGALAGLSTGAFHPGTWIRLAWIAEDTPVSWKFHRGAQAACMIAAVVLAYWIAKRFGAAYGVFVAAVSFMTLIGFVDTASSGPRLTLAFPIAALAGGALAKRPPAVAGSVVAVSAGLMMWFYVLFVRSVGVPFW